MITNAANVPTFTDELLESAREKHIAKGGRPCRMTAEMAAAIIIRVENGESLKSICRDENMCAVSTIHDFKKHSPVFADRLLRARTDGAGQMVDSALDILDSTVNAKSLTEIRSAEIRAKMLFEVGRCYDRDTYGQQSKITGSVNVEYTVGGIIELISGQSKPLVCLDAETVEQSLLCGEHQ